VWCKTVQYARHTEVGSEWSVIVALVKACPQCGVSKPYAEFSANASKADGLQSFCVICNRKAVADWGRARPEKTLRMAKRMCSVCRRSAAARNIDFDLAPQWFEERLVRGRCELTGLPFVFNRCRNPFLPSPDRIDSDKGYTPDNTRLILWMLNSAKGTATEEEFISALKQVAGAISEQG
jgi:hypothetical protein